MLSVLLAERMEMPDHEVAHAQDRPRIFIRELNLHQLLQMTFGPQRRYGADDLLVLQALLQACKNLLYAAKDADTERVLLRHAQAVVDQAAISLSGALDRQAMVEAVRSLNQAVRHAEPCSAPRCGNPECRPLPNAQRRGAADSHHFAIHCEFILKSAS